MGTIMKLQLKTEIRCTLPEFASLIEALRSPHEEEELEALVPHDQLPHFYYLQSELKKKGLLIHETPLIRWIPLQGDHPMEAMDPNASYTLSRFALLRPENGAFVMETPLYPAQVILRNSDALHLLQAFHAPRAPREFPEQIQETLSLLVAAHILTQKEEEATLTWEFHDLFFHSRSRLGRHDTPFGGTYRFQGKLTPLPACKPSVGTLIPLPKPIRDTGKSFDEVIEQRKSVREHGSRPISLQQLGEFLFRTARVKNTTITDEQEYTSRPYPDGGARYELEIYPLIHACDGLAPGVYHYNPKEHALTQISPLTPDAEILLQDSAHSSGKRDKPQVLFVIGARFARVSYKYQSMAYATILKNVGVLFQTMYLIATAMNLAPCALGGGNSDLFCKVTDNSYLEETSVGEFILGSKSNC